VRRLHVGVRGLPRRGVCPARRASPKIQFVPTDRPERSRYIAGVPGSDPPDRTSCPFTDLPGPACLLIEPDGRVAGHNAHFAAWVGRSDVAGLTLGDLFGGDADIDGLWRDATAQGSAVEHHVARSGPDGAGSFWSVRAQRTPAGVLVCAGDVTAFARAAQAVHAAQREYVALAAHELRGPLAAIKAWASAVDQKRRDRTAPSPGDQDALVGDALAVIARQVDRMSDLLGDLLETSRTEAGALRPDRASITVDELVRRAIAGSPFGARVALDGPIPGRVSVDPLHLEAVIGRVLGHVGRGRAEGPIELCVMRAEGGEIHLAVSDRGAAPRSPGNPFGRQGPGHGPGLGLYLCQQLMIANGGRIWREADRFVAALPEGGAGRTVAMAGAPPRMRLLVGEPDAELLSLAASVLRLSEHDVVAVSSGELFFRRLEEAAFDVVIADPEMPGAGGPGGLARLLARRPRPVVVVTTSSPRSEALAGAERAGAHAVLLKPLDWPHLLSLVQAAAAAR
jgi:signal transduction histidine kinase/CheY-like chemotaxis protein